METSKRTLPENAYRKLNPGETYTPVVPHSTQMAEWTPRSVVLGVIMAAVFSAAAAFLGFKVGQVFEAAIPIAILAVGIGLIPKRRSTLLENVIVQSIGAASGLIVAGSIFTLPALFILGLPVDLFKLFLVALCGGILGILLLIPLRRYFVRDMHGEYPFPEATATTEVLAAGASGGNQAKVLALAAGIGGLFDLLIIHFQAFGEVFTTRAVPFLSTLADKTKMVFKINVLASVLGLGYIIGLRYAAIICAGSFVAWFVLVPLISHMAAYYPVDNVEGISLVGQMSAEQIFKSYVRLIGIGGIACAAIIGIIKSWRIIASALTLGFRELFGKKAADGGALAVRTERDFRMNLVFGGVLLMAAVLYAFFSMGVLSDRPSFLALSGIAVLVVVGISFLFTTVSAQAIATVGSNPVSGMTLMTLILTSVILVALGLNGKPGMLAALLIGGVVCTALSTIGGFVTDLKVGYWLGATPAVQQRSKLLGVLVASLTVGAVMLLLNDVYGFVQTPTHPNPLPAPQANAMAAVIGAVMSDQAVPWLLYAVGALFVLVLQMTGIPGLAFALGMYLPLELNTPLLAGGLVAYLVERSAKKDEELKTARRNRGTLVASGFIAGGAIMGVTAALLKWVQQQFGWPTGAGLFNNSEGPGAELLAFGLYICLVIYMYWDSRRAKAGE